MDVEAEVDSKVERRRDDVILVEQEVTKAIVLCIVRLLQLLCDRMCL